MTKKILIFIFIFVAIHSFAKIGNNRDFWIISQHEYNDRISKGKDVIFRRYMPVQTIDKKFQDIFDTRDEQALLAKFSYMLKINTTTWIDKYIENCDNSLGINNLIKGLYCISKKQYAQALTHLEKSDYEEYKFLKLLMIADCKYELLEDKKKYKSIIGAYQIVMDNTDNEQYKSIVNNRIKYIKYR